MILTATALSLGFLHGLGADHLMAIATLSVHPDGAPDGVERREPIRVAVRFALGHALVLLVGAGGVLLLGWQIPALVERTGEIVGGVLLILMGGFTLWVVAAERLYGHTHHAGGVSGTCTSGGAIAIRRRPRTPAARACSARCSPSAACGR